MSLTAGKTLKFRPQDITADRMINRPGGGRYMTRNPLKWRQQGFSWRADYTDDRWLENFAGHLHYKTSHAPRRVQLRWKQAAERWRKRTYWWKARINERI